MTPIKKKLQECETSYQEDKDGLRFEIDQWELRKLVREYCEEKGLGSLEVRSW